MGARDGVGLTLAFPLLAANHISWRILVVVPSSQFLRDHGSKLYCVSTVPLVIQAN